MKYLFVSGSVIDKGGLAMIQGAINGMKRLDKEARFATLLTQEHWDKSYRQCNVFYFPDNMEESFKWTDAVLDVGGLCRGQQNRYIYTQMARKYDKSYIWMSQSFKSGTKKDLVKGTYTICRGNNSAMMIKQIIGKMPPVAADLSFLIKPKKWKGKKYERVFVTHRGKPNKGLFLQCKNKPTIQIIWKSGSINKQDWEPKLPIDKFVGTVEEYFGLIESVKEVWSARYQAACGAILAGIRPKLFITYHAKYNDLLSFYGMTKKQLRESAMLSCNVVWKILKGG